MNELKLASWMGDPCQHQDCLYNPYGICRFGGFNCGLQCPKVSGKSINELKGIANLRMDEGMRKTSNIETLWDSELNIAGYSVPGRLLLKYCSVIFSHHTMITCQSLLTKDIYRRGMHLLICEFAGVDHDEPKFKRALETEVEKLMGKMEPHLFSRLGRVRPSALNSNERIDALLAGEITPGGDFNPK